MYCSMHCIRQLTCISDTNCYQSWNNTLIAKTTSTWNQLDTHNVWWQRAVDEPVVSAHHLSTLHARNQNSTRAIHDQISFATHSLYATFSFALSSSLGNMSLIYSWHPLIRTHAKTYLAIRLVTRMPFSLASRETNLYLTPKRRHTQRDITQNKTKPERDN